MSKAKTYTCKICAKNGVAWSTTDPAKLKEHLVSHLDTSTGTVGPYSIFGVK